MVLELALSITVLGSVKGVHALLGCIEGRGLFILDITWGNIYKRQQFITMTDRIIRIV